LHLSYSDMTTPDFLSECFARTFCRIPYLGENCSIQ
jgi:hypothetical protein